MRKKSKKGDSCNPLVSMVLRKRKHKLYMFDITFFNVKMYSNEINEIKNFQNTFLFYRGGRKYESY